MRKGVMALVVLFFLASLAYAQTPELPGWKLVWSDEFNYTGHPDPAKWGYEDGYVRHNELQYYTVNRLERPGGWPQSADRAAEGNTPEFLADVYQR